MEKFKTETLEPLGLRELFERKFVTEADFLLCLNHGHWAFSSSYLYWQCNSQQYPSLGDLIHFCRFVKSNIGVGLNVKMNNGRYITFFVNEDMSLTETIDLGPRTTDMVDLKDVMAEYIEKVLFKKYDKSLIIFKGPDEKNEDLGAGKIGTGETGQDMAGKPDGAGAGPETGNINLGESGQDNQDPGKTDPGETEKIEADTAPKNPGRVAGQKIPGKTASKPTRKRKPEDDDVKIVGEKKVSLFFIDIHIYVL